jgi:hypothetical protein
LAQFHFHILELQTAMANARLKTAPTGKDVITFLNGVEGDSRRQDGLELLEMMKEITGEPPVMWGPSIVGFGQYHYRYASGREGDFMITGFSPRKQSISVYIMPGFDRYTELMQKLGKHKTGKSCLYINKLADIDRDVLRQLIHESYTYMKQKYG